MPHEKALNANAERIVPDPGVTPPTGASATSAAPGLPLRTTVSEELLPGLLVIADSLTIASISCTVVIVYLQLLVQDPGLHPWNYAMVTMLGMALLVQHLNAAGAYRLERLHNIRFQARKVAVAWVTVFGLLLTALVLLKISAFFSRVWLVSWFFSHRLHCSA